MIRVSKWLREARKHRFIFSVLYVNSREFYAIMRKGPLVDKKQWELIKRDLRMDGFWYDKSYMGWYRGIESEKWARIFFRP